ncbi:hypothetical protein J6590_077635 [Homalodisca vitripennis]|nr:hypothetical protein J6590_077635 [Homalodisca vitripennis]
MTSIDPVVVRQAKIEQEQHHRKSESAYTSMTSDSISSASPTTDRNFAIIEKRWKRVQAETPDDVKRAIITSRHERPFKVVEMAEQFLDFDQAASSIINTKKLGISTASWIRIEKKKPGVVQTKKTFNEIEPWVDHYVFNPGVNERTLQTVNLESLPETVDLSIAKKEDLRKMLPYIKEENRKFFEKIV